VPPSSLRECLLSLIFKTRVGGREPALPILGWASVASKGTVTSANENRAARVRRFAYLLQGVKNGGLMPAHTPHIQLSFCYYRSSMSLLGLLPSIRSF